jgi:hypothetical protein
VSSEVVRDATWRCVTLPAACGYRCGSGRLYVRGCGVSIDRNRTCRAQCAWQALFRGAVALCSLQPVSVAHAVSRAGSPNWTAALSLPTLPSQSCNVAKQYSASTQCGNMYGDVTCIQHHTACEVARPSIAQPASTSIDQCITCD